MTTLTPAQARRIALGAQGFARCRPAGVVSSRQFRRAMEQMTILQLDSVNVLCRSHYLPMMARLGPYDRARLDAYLYRSGEHFEYLSHEASITAQMHQPLLRHRARRPPTWARRFADDMPDYLDAVLAEVSERGPLTAGELEDPGSRTGPWWGQSKGKRALECLYVTGRLAIRERTAQFVKVYDLPERVLDAETLAKQEPSEADAVREMLMLAARSHGIGTIADLADYFRLRTPVARPAIADLVAGGRLEQVGVRGWDEPAYLHPEARRPRRIRGSALLSPFDPVVWFRPRAERLFNFRYRIEMYLPAAKRIHGYYVLPYLLDGELVGRVDLKADRKERVLRVRRSWVEDSVVSPTDRARVAGELRGSLDEMAEWLDLDAVAIAPEGDLANALARVTPG